MNRALAPRGAAGDGWHARLKLGFTAGENRTLLAERQRHGPLSVQRPFYPEGDVCHVYILHPPGGVVGGDQIEQDVRVDAGAAALITTPGATKFYRSAGEDALVTNRLSVIGSLEWLPQETIVFDKARIRQRTLIDLSEEASFIGWEMICLGRPASDHWFEEGSAAFSMQVQQNGKLILNERLPVTASLSLTSPACLRGHFFTATMLVTPISQHQIEVISRYFSKQVKDELLTTTLLDNLLVIRYLGDQPNQCRKHFESLWKILRQEVLQRSPTPPRIWNT